MPLLLLDCRHPDLSSVLWESRFLRDADDLIMLFLNFTGLVLWKLGVITKQFYIFDPCSYSFKILALRAVKAATLLSTRGVIDLSTLDRFDIHLDDLWAKWDPEALKLGMLRLLVEFFSLLRLFLVRLGLLFLWVFWVLRALSMVRVIWLIFSCFVGV